MGLDNLYPICAYFGMMSDAMFILWYTLSWNRITSVPLQSYIHLIL